MSAVWYYTQDGIQNGPFSIEDLRTLLDSGALRPTGFVWAEGLPAWEHVGHVPELIPMPASPPPTHLDPSGPSLTFRKPRKFMIPLVIGGALLMLIVGGGIIAWEKWSNKKDRLAASADINMQIAILSEASPIEKNSAKPSQNTDQKILSINNLIQQELGGSIKILIPSNWIKMVEDAGESGSATTWSDPLDSTRMIKINFGTMLGVWYQADGVSGSINPKELIPDLSSIERINRTTFKFQVLNHGTDPVTSGIWKAELGSDGTPVGFMKMEVSLAAAEIEVTSHILTEFAGQNIQPGK